MRQKQYTLTFFIALIAISMSYGQAKIGAFGEIIVEEAAPVPEILLFSKANNKAKKKTERKKRTKKAQLTKIETQQKKTEKIGQTNFKVLIMTVDSPLDLTHHIFSSYKNVNFSQSKSDGYTYFSGGFTDEDEAKRMLEKVQRVYPKATMISEQTFLPVPGRR